MAELKKTDYLFATARIRAMEKGMLSGESVERMIDSKSPAEALKVLYDLEYGFGGEMLSPHDFEELLTQEHKKAYDLVVSIAPQKDIFLMFRYPYDYHNIKTLLKAEFANVDADSILICAGSIDISALKLIVRERNLLGLTENMRNGLVEAVDTYARTGDPQTIDLILDKACYDDMLKSAKASGVPFVLGYVKLLIDTINLKSFVRLKKMNKSWDFFSKIYLDGGNITLKTFIAGYDEPYSQFAEKLIAYGLCTPLLEGGAEITEKGKFTTLEKLCDNKLIDYVKNAKYVSFGIEPLVAYLIAKENEIKIARIIMAGKIANLNSELIRERLRVTYV